MLSMFVASNADPVPGCFALSVILRFDIVWEMRLLLDGKGNCCSDKDKIVIL
jgi:hypothetical protein